MVDSMTLAVLKRARKLLHRGWTKGTSYTKVRVNAHSVDAYCLTGALNKAAELENYPYTLVKRAVIAELPKTITGFPRDIVQFNDDPKTKYEDVLKVIDKAIERASS